jgi:phenylalanyl-tRNA synthetase alpha chain
VTLDEFRAEADRLQELAANAAAEASSLAALRDARNLLLGRANGQISALMRALASLAPDERREAGARANALRAAAEQLLEDRESDLQAAARSDRPSLDLTMPARHNWRGGKHPVTLVIEEITEIFRDLGFTIATGPEVETEWYNFHSLNFPPEHPAMDLHDTLYLSDDLLLRTHTSPVQMRTLQEYPPPIRVLIPGNVYRRDFFDASHAPMFSQIEGLAVDEGTSFVDLKATLSYMATRLFGTTRTRFRPSFFPFTEPSAELDVSCSLCSGAGCPSCKQTGWMEILGAGMVHPAVLESAGVDAERYTGWAFGMGPGRIAMLRYGIPDIRLLYDSDVRFLEQFAK